jgi:hypothetical protein
LEFAREKGEEIDSFNKLVDLRFQQRYGTKPKTVRPEITNDEYKKLKQIRNEVKELTKQFPLYPTI